MFRTLFRRNNSYCLGVAVLIVFMLYYIIISNKSINSLQNDYGDIMDNKQYLNSQIPKSGHDRNSIKAKNNITYRNFDAFSSMAKKENFSKHIIVHLDLKGAPPKLEYLTQFMALIKSLGATGMLVEYEDMFPYSGKLSNLSALNAYSPAEITDLYNTAKAMKLEFIPLLQTFGHMEFMLKLEEFSHLREVPAYPQAICPSNNDTMSTIKLMIDQVMTLHPGLNWIHIGSDEVYNLGECKKCQQAIATNNWSKAHLFMSHAIQVATYIKNSHHVTPIMWDDELRNIPLDVLEEFDIWKIVEIMVWKYSPGIAEKISANIWDKYAHFSGVWMASAFKGAEKIDSFITDVSKRLSNNKEWMEIFHMMTVSIPFKGIALTGWQRFDHFAVLCELLPQAVPSLALSIAYIKTNKVDDSTVFRIGDTLHCDSLLNTDLEYMQFANECHYAGAGVLKAVQKLHMLKRDVNSLLDSKYMKGYLAPYNIKYNFTSPHYVETGFQYIAMLRFECTKLTSESRKAMADIYDQVVIDEWLELHLLPLQKKLDDLQVLKASLHGKSSWQRGPQGMKERKMDIIRHL